MVNIQNVCHPYSECDLHSGGGQLDLRVMSDELVMSDDVDKVDNGC